MLALHALQSHRLAMGRRLVAGLLHSASYAVPHTGNKLITGDKLIVGR
jgi:hypothetical protein